MALGITKVVSENVEVLKSTATKSYFSSSIVPPNTIGENGDVCEHINGTRYLKVNNVWVMTNKALLTNATAIVATTGTLDLEHNLDTSVVNCSVYLEGVKVDTNKVGILLKDNNTITVSNLTASEIDIEALLVLVTM